MHSVTTLERICADAWPPIASQPLGQWRLRAAHGATACVLQVATSDTAANALYARCDFSESHRYRYWVPNSACEDHPL